MDFDYPGRSSRRHHSQVDDWQGEVKSVIARVERISSQATISGPTDSTELANAMATAFTLMLSALSTSIGECRRQAPYSTLRPIIDEAGNFYWCCNHDLEHRSS